jgi:hypothetical protein
MTLGQVMLEANDVRYKSRVSIVMKRRTREEPCRPHEMRLCGAEHDCGGTVTTSFLNDACRNNCFLSFLYGRKAIKDRVIEFLLHVTDEHDLMVEGQSFLIAWVFTTGCYEQRKDWGGIWRRKMQIATP